MYSERDKLLGSRIAGGNTAYQRNAQDSYPTPPDATIALLDFLKISKRLPLFRQHPPRYILPLSWRPDFLFKERGNGAPLMDVMWCVWLMEPTAQYPRYIVLERPKIN